MMETTLSSADTNMLDRGLQFGDGLFETIAVISERPCLLDRHLARLYKGCERLGISPPDNDSLRAKITKITAGKTSAVLKIILTRGESNRGYRIPDTISPCLYISISEWPEYPASYATEGVHVRICDTPLGLNPKLAGIKHLNRLEQVMARNEWSDPEITEGLMLDVSGNVIEGTMSNLFLLTGDRLLTPSLSASGVAGVVRQLLIDTAQELGQPVQETIIQSEELFQANALYLTNSLIGIWPVKQLKDKHWNCAMTDNPVIHAAAKRIFQG